eukprot:gene2196-2707_t
MLTLSNNNHSHPHLLCSTASTTTTSISTSSSSTSSSSTNSSIKKLNFSTLNISSSSSKNGTSSTTSNSNTLSPQIILPPPIILSPRKNKSPSKMFTKLIKRDSDSSVFKSPTRKASIEEFDLSGLLGTPRSTTDDCFDYISSTTTVEIESANTSSPNDEYLDPIEERKDPFTEKFILGSLLGEGATCKVYLVTERKSGNKYAAKILPTRMELFDEIIDKKVFTEEETKKVMRQLLNALFYLHQKKIAHRDLKPENIKYSSCDPDAQIKLLDFGFARFLSENGVPLQAAGTLGYEAPEILNNSHQTCAVDMWALGVICYIMLSGYPPFMSWSDDICDESKLDNSPFWLLFNDDTPDLRKSILTADFQFKTYHWDKISIEAKQFITELLTIDPNKRLTSLNALNHNWIKS